MTVLPDAAPLWAEAAFWGLTAGSALVAGAFIAWFVPIPRRLIAAIMAFGAGVLIASVAFELIDEAVTQGGLWPVVAGLVGGAVLFSLANIALDRFGATHRKRSGEEQPAEHEDPGSGAAIALGALLDGIPESVVIGISLLAGGQVSAVTVAAIFISNIPEGLSSAAGMRRAGRSARYVFGVWGGIALLSGVAALTGFSLFEAASDGFVASTNAFAAGAILAMIVDTMIPESCETTPKGAGLFATFGFIAGLALSRGMG